VWQAQAPKYLLVEERLSVLQLVKWLFSFVVNVSLVCGEGDLEAEGSGWRS
jgi:hypothetical protein